jgi:multimeric flavodoxin WrbA
MKKILGIIGSPRKFGNCEIMIKEISRHLTVPHDLQLLRLVDFNIKPCRGCYRCLPEGETCVLDDDLKIVLAAMEDADALIVAAPTYFLAANASLKRLLDRGLAFYNHSKRLWDKPAVGIGIAGIEGKEGYTLLCIQSFLKLILAQDKGSRIIYGALPGEIFMDEKNKTIAAQMAADLFEPVAQKSTPSCPVCGGDTFRFLGGNGVRCMLCSVSGTVELSSGTPVFEMNTDEHVFFAGKDAALRHRDWLLGMKADFISKKDRLKQISAAYLKDGSWIKPAAVAPETAKE